MVCMLPAPSETSPNSTTALYKDDGDPRSTFVRNTQEVLERVADVSSDLQKYFPVPEQEAMSGISRVSGYLNLLYHQVSFHLTLKMLASNIYISASCLLPGRFCSCLLRFVPNLQALR
jgi:hypothetical protein